MELVKDILLVVFLFGASACMIALAVASCYEMRRRREEYRALMERLTPTVPEDWRKDHELQV